MKRLLVILLVLVACNSSEAASSGYVLDEGSIAGPDSLATAGETKFQISNVGEFGHTFVVADSDGNVLGTTEVLPPGDEASLVLDLDPGQYQVSCRLVTQDGEGNIIDHYEVGMYRNVTVGS